MFKVSGKFFFLEWFLVETHFKQILKFSAAEKRQLAEMLDPGFWFCNSRISPAHQSLKTC